jgi:hypothetical protein
MGQGSFPYTFGCYRYRLTEAEACSGVVLRNPSRKGMRDGDLEVIDLRSALSILLI